ncbi:MAG TPA: efflux RND transporter periplasmic adaptor subunit [Opitutus sp.]|nr:efflux RND transporter periplasmic adaptor subunit [Opitutus sp.]
MKFSLLLSAFASVAAFSGCARHAEPAAAPALPAARVRLVTARIATAPVLTEVTGTIRPVQRATIAAKVMGAIDELPVALGQPVHAGDLLLRISAAEISAKVAQAQAQLNLARRDLDRERDLLTKGASTADMVKGLEDRFAMTQAMVREAETMLGYATIRAPFDGVVARKFVNAGDLAAPGQPLLEIEGAGAFEVDAAVPDSLIGPLAVGQRLAVAVPSAGLAFPGLVTEISSAADPAAHTVLVKIAVPQEATVRSGQFARVSVPGSPVPAILVPATAVTTYGQLERVFVAGAGHHAELRLVKTGAARGDDIEILSGLDDGESVVAPVPANLREGQPLEAQP